MTRRRPVGRGWCGPGPGEDFDESLEKAQADGVVSTGDADEVRNFASFLKATAGIPTSAAERTPEQQQAFLKAYAEHYPEEYAQAMAEQKARQKARQADGRLPAP